MSILERSKRALLDVSIAYDGGLGSPHEAPISEVSKNIDRIKSLHLSTTSPRIFHNFLVAAPELETLNIFSAEQPAELGFLFGGNLPALRSLVLAGLPSWPLGLFSNLKNLHLILPPSHPTTKVSSLIDIMSRSPGIERIKMGEFLSVTDDSPPSSLVHLPNLQKFTMYNCDSATVLSHTHTPATADIKVIIDHCKVGTMIGIPSHDRHILYSVPGDMSTIGFLMESTTFALQQDHKVGFGMGFYRSRSSQPSLRVLACSPSIKSFARRSIEVLVNHPHHFRNIKDLYIALSAGSTVPWSRLLQPFKQLERLGVIAIHVPSILHALTVVGEDGHPTCPALKRLDFHEKADGHAVAVDEEGVVQFFAARRVLGCAVAEVNIESLGGRRRLKRRDSGERTAGGRV